MKECMNGEGGGGEQVAEKKDEGRKEEGGGGGGGGQDLKGDEAGNSLPEEVPDSCLLVALHR